MSGAHFSVAFLTIHTGGFPMNWVHTISKRASLLVAALVIAGCASMGGPQTVQVRLTGDEEVPPVKTSASGTASVTVGEDRSVSGSIRTQGIAGIAAHIHEA